MARAKRKLPAKPAAFISPQHRSHFCRRHPIPEHKAPAADNTHPTKTHGPVKRHRPTPEHKKPAADNTHPTKTSRPGQTAPTDARTQKNPLPLRTPPAAFISPHYRGHFCPVIRYPNTKPPPPTIHTPQKPHGSVKRHRPTPEHKKPAAAPNTAGRFRFL